MLISYTCEEPECLRLTNKKGALVTLDQSDSAARSRLKLEYKRLIKASPSASSLSTPSREVKLVPGSLFHPSKSAAGNMVSTEYIRRISMCICTVYMCICFIYVHL